MDAIPSMRGLMRTERDCAWVRTREGDLLQLSIGDKRDLYRVLA
jgi:hypothetical protein